MIESFLKFSRASCNLCTFYLLIAIYTPRQRGRQRPREGFAWIINLHLLFSVDSENHFIEDDVAARFDLLFESLPNFWGGFGSIETRKEYAQLRSILR